MTVSGGNPARVRLGTVVAAALAVLVMGRMPALADVAVGKTIKVDVPAAGEASKDDLRASYKRPATIPFPKDNPYTFEKAALGKKLYFDPRLSQAKLLSCASCHNPAYGWGDGLPKGVGHMMKQLGRRSPTVINAAYGSIFMWDGRAPTLEAQALGPVESEAEMALPLKELVKRLNEIGEYKVLFAHAFPRDGITKDNIAKAIATYERTVISSQAPFDAWVDGDETAISEAAKRGFAVFNGKALCSGCHSGWNFTDESFRDIGLPGDDIGFAKYMPDAVTAKYAFKTPGLREIMRRGPYMHDGSLATLEDVVEHYNAGGIDRPSRSDLVKPLGLSDREKSDLVAFLKTLDSHVMPTTVPVLPR